MANQNSKNKNNNQKKKNNNGKGNNTTKKNTNVKANNNANNSKKVVKKEEVKTEVKKVEKVVPAKKEEVKKEKKGFSLTSKQKDLILVALVAVLLVVGLLVSGAKKEEKVNIELPVALEGEAGFTEMTYSEYEEKMESGKPFVMVVVRDGCHYCELYEPVVTEVTSEYSVPFYFINLAHLSEDEYTKLGTSNSYLKNKEWGTPTTLFMNGKDVIDSIGGYVEKDELVNFVKKNFKVADENAE